MNVKTSETDPIRVDWLNTPWPGRVGLTFAPGKKVDSLFGWRWERDLRQDLARFRDTYAATHLVSLIEDHEMDHLGIPDLVLEAEAAGLLMRRLPIRDVTVPLDDQAVRELVSGIVNWASGGANVVIHCRGGLGRAGTIGGCVLVASGLTGEVALQQLRDVRGPNCPETDEQRRYVMRFQVDAS